MTPPTIGELLREFRVRACVSQGDLAEKASLSVDAVGTIERGERKVPYRSTLRLLAKALDLSPEERTAIEDARAYARGKPRKFPPPA